MNREDLAKAIVAACKWIEEPQVVIFGSQSLLGSYDADVLPEEATRSAEVDMTPGSAFTDQTFGGRTLKEKVSILDVWVGEDSDFHAMHGIYVEGIHKETVILPRGWDNRLVRFDVPDESGENTYGRVALCLDPVDACISKLLAGREKDHEYVGALIRADIITAEVMLERVDKYGIAWPAGYLEHSELALSRAQSWLRAHLPTQLDPSAPHSALSAAMGSHPHAVKKLLNTATPAGTDGPAVNTPPTPETAVQPEHGPTD